MYRRLSIQKRLALILWGSALFAFILASLALMSYQNLTLQNRALQIMQPYANLVSIGSEAAIVFEDPLRAQEILNSLQANPQILEAEIILQSGRVLASINNTSNNRPHTPTTKNDGVYIEESNVELLQSLTSGAHLRICMDRAQLNEQSQQAVWIFGAGVLILLIATFGQYAVLQRIIVKPISTLTDAAEHVRKQADYKHRVATVGNDEVARLGKSFNAMLHAIQEKQQLLLEAQHIAQLGNWWHDRVTNEIFWSDEFFRILGREPQKPTIEQSFEWVHPEDLADLKKAIQAPAMAGKNYQHEYRIIRPDGEVRWVSNRWAGVFDQAGKEIKRVGTHQDITEQKLAAEAMQKLNRELSAITECNQVLVRAEDEQSLLDAICHIVCEQAGYQMAWVGFAEHDAAKTLRPVAWAGAENGYLKEISLSWADSEHVHGPSGSAVREGVIKSLDTFSQGVETTSCRDAALQRGYQSMISLPLKDDHATAFGVLSIYSSVPNAFPQEEQRLLEELADDLAFGIITLRVREEQSKAEQQIEHLAFYDHLTDLPNRRLLLDRLHQAMLGSARSQHMGALLFIDLDNFKMLNDTFGHEAGDKLLIEVAQRLKTCVRENDTISRLGGDEFVIMLEDLHSTLLEAELEARKVANKVFTALNKPYRMDGRMDGRIHHSTPSIGATVFLGSENSVDELLKQADIAMYQAKAAGRNTIRFFDPGMQHRLATRAHLEADLRNAVHDNHLVLYYQVQVDNQSNIIAVEALLRWQHPERGLIPPNEFIPLAEETGLILPIGQWVLENSCRQLAKWSIDPELKNLKMSINVSALQFRQKDFVEKVRQALIDSTAPASQLKLEITESLLLGDVNDSIHKMYELKKLGLGFSIDDFGTGYSSLSYLTKLPLDQLKIDLSFIHNLPHSPNDCMVVQTILLLAQNLNLTVVAEGVETEAQQAFLKQHGCPIYQGYLFSKPVDVASFESFYNTSKHQ
jgi:diguanylate cyclase (GGDEF)-like protein/PAS domain S-box-containing protein